ncbi:adenylosuccinate synthetase [Candidatus Woesearchaeota archaeon]|nr:adenylosuccinate synthetase [Candidatus Woesearchaeota archaeon]
MEKPNYGVKIMTLTGLLPFTMPLFMKDVKVASVLCFQWGDTGKGKVVAYFGSWADINIRGTGTDNAGHTFYVKHKGRDYKCITHFIPAGIQYDGLGKTTILGSGMGINQKGLLEEMVELAEAGITFNNMMISEDANVILKYHKKRDAPNKSMKDGSVGSTGKGTGPMYSDHVARRGIKFRDLFNRDIFAAKVKKIYSKEYKDLGIDINEVIEEELKLFEKVKPFVKDTKSFIERALLENEKILIEGAQGTLLSYEFGTYPFVTSSDPSILGTARGCDIPINCVDLVIGLIKFPVMTRVGPGPFPTEYGAGMSESYCAEGDGYKNVKSFEEERFRTVPLSEMMNDRDEFRRGLGLRRVMDEYGATTGRPRRTGRVDAVAGRHAVQVNSVGPRIILASTKSDCVRGMHELEIGTRYVYASQMMTFNTAGRAFSTGDTTDRFSTNADLLYKLRGQYETFDGFEDDVSGIRAYKELPIQLRAPHERFEELVGAPFGMISVGPGTDEIIIRDLNQ